MYVGIESESASLNIKWKQVDVETAGAHNSDRQAIINNATEMKVGVRDAWC